MGSNEKLLDNEYFLSRGELSGERSRVLWQPQPYPQGELASVGRASFCKYEGALSCQSYIAAIPQLAEGSLGKGDVPSSILGGGSGTVPSPSLGRLQQMLPGADRLTLVPTGVSSAKCIIRANDVGYWCSYRRSNIFSVTI